MKCGELSTPSETIGDSAGPAYRVGYDTRRGRFASSSRPDVIWWGSNVAASDLQIKKKVGGRVWANLYISRLNHTVELIKLSMARPVGMYESFLGTCTLPIGLYTSTKSIKAPVDVQN